MDVSGNTNHTKKALEYNYKLIGAVYHEFVLISLFVVWPAITLGLLVAVVKLWRDNKRLQAI
jgi:hypothetical protein